MRAMRAGSSLVPGGFGFGLALLAAALVRAQEPEPPEETQRGAVPAPPPSIEEIVVVGVRSVPGADAGEADSVTSFSSADLAAFGAESIEDLASHTPNLEIVTAGSTTPTFFIRGVGLNDFNPNSTGAVALYHDGVAINAPALQLSTLFDMEAVNIERGPHGTGLGRNASAGMIQLYSRKPSGEFGGYLRSDFGNFDFQDYEGALEAPIVDDLLAGRLAFRLSKRDGTMKNRCAGAPLFDDGTSFCGEPLPRRDEFSPLGLEKYVNDTNNWAARGTLRIEPTLDSTWLVGAHGSRRNELSRLGQSIGTGGSFCLDGKICEPTPADRRDTPQLVDTTAKSNGLLGGRVNTEPPSPSGYWPREIQARLIELAPCFANGGDCRTVNNRFLPLAERLAANEAKIQLANELAKNLDSEPWEGDFNRTGPTENDTYGGYAKGEISLPWGIQLTSTNAFDGYDRYVYVDLDFSPAELFEIETDDQAWQYYTDLNFAGEAFGDSLPVYLEAGGWFLREELEATVTNNLGSLQQFGVGSRDYTQQLWSTAVYGAFSFDFWDDFTLDGGVRYNWENKTLDMLVRQDPTLGGTPGAGAGRASDCSRSPTNPDHFTCADTWQAPTGTLRLTYRFRADTEAYWKYTRGWKPGSYNATASQLNGPTIATPEQIDSFETGLHGRWLDERLEIDTSFFYYAYADYQIFTARQFLGGTPEFVILNADDAEVYGTEVDAVARPWEGAVWNLRFSWLESQFLDYVTTDQFLASSGGGDLVIFKETQNSGNPLLNSPEFKISITAEQSVELGRYGAVTLRYDGVWTDTTYFDATRGVGLGDRDGNKFLPSETIAQVPFWLHNLRLSWKAPDDRVELALWVRNIENQAYKTFAFDGSTFRQTTIYFVGDPRTFGASIGITF